MTAFQHLYLLYFLDNIFARERFCTGEDLILSSDVSAVSILEREGKT